jgi:hypothetical protein
VQATRTCTVTSLPSPDNEQTKSSINSDLKSENSCAGHRGGDLVGDRQKLRRSSTAVQQQPHDPQQDLLATQKSPTFPGRDILMVMDCDHMWSFPDSSTGCCATMLVPEDRCLPLPQWFHNLQHGTSLTTRTTAHVPLMPYFGAGCCFITGCAAAPVRRCCRLNARGRCLSQLLVTLGGRVRHFPW